MYFENFDALLAMGKHALYVWSAYGICLAIRARRLLEFDYHGKHRIVAPYCHGITTRGSEALRAIQLGGDTRPGGLGFGKLWLVAEIENLRVTTTSFAPLLITHPMKTSST